MSLRREPPAPLGPADDPRKLWEMQVAVNKRDSKQYHFFGHSIDLDGKWWCWYEIKESDFRVAEQESNEQE